CRSYCASLTILVWAIAAGAQGGNQGAINGTIKDSSGALIPSVLIQAQRVETGSTFLTTTDDRGAFHFPVLPTGFYDLIATQPQFRSATIKNFLVTVGAVSDVVITLELGSTQ